jgi:hypothetical protein
VIDHQCCRRVVGKIFLVGQNSSRSPHPSEQLVSPFPHPVFQFGHRCPKKKSLGMCQRACITLVCVRLLSTATWTWIDHGCCQSYHALGDCCDV